MALPGLAASGADRPTRQGGLWQVSLSTEPARAPVVVVQCTSAERDWAMLLALVPGQEHCAAPTHLPDPAQLAFQTRCRVHGHEVVARLRLAGDFRESFAVDYRVWSEDEDTDTPGHHHAPQKGHLQGKYLGACPAPMQAGDMRLSNGIVVHVPAPTDPTPALEHARPVPQPSRDKPAAASSSR